MQKVRPFLWFDDRAAEAAKFYVAIFKGAEIVSPQNIDALDASDVMSVTFRIDGREYVAFNGGPHYKFTPAISLFVDCETQDEVDYYWERLSEGGEELRCGWLTDKFGLTGKSSRPYSSTCSAPKTKPKPPPCEKPWAW